MRPNRLAVPQTENRSFDLRHELLPYFTNPWHFHPEIELNYVVASTGTRFIGQSVERFRSGEIVLLGKNLPHFWKNDALFYGPERPFLSEAIVARFAEDFLGKSFWELPETAPIQALLNRAIPGLRLLEPLRSVVASRLESLVELTGFAQLNALLTILDLISQSSAVAVISPGYLPSQLLSKQSERLSKVIGFLLTHFAEPVSLQQLADLASMNPAAFCRYFKSQTGQTPTQFITELRIRAACDLLGQTDATVSQISEQVGFENVSHFVQVFRKKQQQTPVTFRKQIR